MKKLSDILSYDLLLEFRENSLEDFFLFKMKVMQHLVQHYLLRDFLTSCRRAMHDHFPSAADSERVYNMGLTVVGVHRCPVRRPSPLVQCVRMNNYYATSAAANTKLAS